MKTILILCALALAVSARRFVRQAAFSDEPQVTSGGPCAASNGPGTCTTHSECKTLPDDLQTLLNTPKCPLGTETGICCPTNGPPATNEVTPISDLTLRQQGGALPFSANDIDSAITDAQQALQERDALEQRLLREGIVAQPGSTEARHQFIQFTEEQSRSDAREAFVNGETATTVALRNNLLNRDITSKLPSVNVASTSLAANCPKEPNCPATKYRTIDGSCNNLQNRNWGKSLRGFARMMPPHYADGVSKPRVAKGGGDLPSARLVSSSVLTDRNVEAPQTTFLLMTFGQFLDHDLTQTPLTRGANGSGIVCCSAAVLSNPANRHPECLAIDIPANDPFYARHRQTCMEFVRASPASLNSCTLSWREQQNQLTSFVDASQIYGSTETTTNRLRTHSGGKLLSTTGPGGKEFPPHNNTAGCQGNPSAGSFCFVAGDTRPAEQPSLATLHVIFLREHNRIADELARTNPGWNDGIIFEETRRIIGAMMQHIVYNEYLPVILGRRVMRTFGLLPQRNGFSDNYDSNLDPTIFNEFATAAYRFGHSQVPGTFQLKGAQNIQQRLRDLQLRPYDSRLFDSYIGGSVSQKSNIVDNLVTEDLTTQLFRSQNAQFGLDLPAVNMQRGRDHGIAGYNDFRNLCNLPKATSFNDVAGFTSPEVSNKMSSVYKDVDDIDLWLGGVTEKPLSGALVGPTFACIIAEQFRRTKDGDRFWYERGNTESSFSEAQLAEIRKSSLARLLCDNSDVKTMQPLVFWQPEDWNPQVDCNGNQIPRMSLRPWRNEPVWT